MSVISYVRFILMAALLATSCSNSGPPGGDANACTPACAPGLACCSGRCVELSSDLHNCGACGVACSGATPYCQGTCIERPCQSAACTGDTCCGSSCCASGEICCLRTEAAAVPRCVAPVNGTCPVNCTDCQ